MSKKKGKQMSNLPHSYIDAMEGLQMENEQLRQRILILESEATNNDVSGTVWIVQDTMNGMIAGMFDSQIKAIKYTDKSKGMAIINMEL
tara:strand:+ start:261 stop:527 length:267 start_codon:yes stop_codon:yes gene_type:complete